MEGGAESIEAIRAENRNKVTYDRGAGNQPAIKSSFQLAVAESGMKHLEVRAHTGDYQTSVFLSTPVIPGNNNILASINVQEIVTYQGDTSVRVLQELRLFPYRYAGERGSNYKEHWFPKGDRVPNAKLIVAYLERYVDRRIEEITKDIAHYEQTKSRDPWGSYEDLKWFWAMRLGLY